MRSTPRFAPPYPIRALAILALCLLAWPYALGSGGVVAAEAGTEPAPRPAPATDSEPNGEPDGGPEDAAKGQEDQEDPHPDRVAKEVRFLLHEAMSLPAWLAAGPFPEPLAALETENPGATEGAAIGNRRWRYLNAGREQLVDLRGLERSETAGVARYDSREGAADPATDGGGIAAPRFGEKRYYYAITELEAGQGMRLSIAANSTGTLTLWLDGAKVLTQTPRADGGREPGRAMAMPGDGRMRLLVRLEDPGPSPAFVVDVDGALLRNFLRLRPFDLKRQAALIRPFLATGVEPRWLKEQDRLRFTLGLEHGTPLPEGPTLQVLVEGHDRDGRFFETRTPRRKVASIHQRSMSVSAPLERRPRGLRNVIRARLVAEDVAFATVETHLFDHQALGRRLRAFADRVLALRRAGRDAALPRLRMEQIELLLQDRLRYTYAFGQRIVGLLEEAEGELAALEAGRDPLAGRVGVQEGGYVSAADGSPQPYRYYIPTPPAGGWSTDNPMPLVVLLHGYVPSYTKLDWLRVSPALAASLEEVGCCMLIPFGRSNTDFLSIGEEDVLRAIEEMRGRWPIDPTRIYLAGYSMGGSGVWTLLSHYPDRFAAAYLWSGRTDYFHWHAETIRAAGLARETYPPYKRILIETDNPFDLAATLRSIPIRAVHPLDDPLVKPGHTARILEKLAPPRGRMEIGPAPEGYGHFFFANELNTPAPYRWLLQHRLSQPDTVTHVTYTPKYGRKFWLDIAMLDIWGKPAHVEATLDRAAKRVTLAACENVAALVLRDPTGRVRFDETWRIVLPNGEDRAWRPGLFAAAPTTPGEATTGEATEAEAAEAKGSPAKDGPSKAADPNKEQAAASAEAPAGGMIRSESLRRRLSAAKGAVLPLKRGRLCGPVKEAFNRPFLLVVGTGGDDADRRRNQANAQRFETEWEAFAKGKPQRVADTSLTATEWATMNLVCFGTPATHRYLAALPEGYLPFRFLKDGYGVGAPVGRKGSGLEVRLDDPATPGQLGFVGIYPKPTLTQAAVTGGTGYLVIIDGLYYGQRLPINHKWDLAPDFVIFGPEADTYDGVNRARIAGFFDSAWRFDRATTWVQTERPTPAAVTLPKKSTPAESTTTH